MKEDLSALVDAESTASADAQSLLRQAVADQGLRESWELYHLIGDTLRGTSGQGIKRTEFAARLAAEPTVIAPAAATRPAARERTTASRWMMPMAASLAAIGFVGWMASALLPQQAGEVAQAGKPSATPVAATPVVVVSTPQPEAAPVNAPVAGGSPAGNTVTVAAPSIALPPATIPVAYGVDDYLWAHQRFAPAASAYRVRPARHEAR